MAGTVTPDDASYSHFNDGFASRNNPMTAIDKKILNFAVKVANNPSTKVHGQIVRNFGMYPPEFWTRAQRLTEHPDADPAAKDVLSYLFADPSRPGPMGGGAPIKTDDKSFSHGLTW
jgi:hypothetical protein